MRGAGERSGWQALFRTRRNSRPTQTSSLQGCGTSAVRRPPATKTCMRPGQGWHRRRRKGRRAVMHTRGAPAPPAGRWHFSLSVGRGTSVAGPALRQLPSHDLIDSHLWVAVSIAGQWEASTSRQAPAATLLAATAARLWPVGWQAGQQGMHTLLRGLPVVEVWLFWLCRGRLGACLPRCQGEGGAADAAHRQQGPKVPAGRACSPCLSRRGPWRRDEASAKEDEPAGNAD